MIKVTPIMHWQQNICIKYRVRVNEVEATIVRAVMQNEGINQSKVCRIINGKEMSDCKFCHSYANHRKQRAGRTHSATCPVKRGRVIYLIKKLERLGILTRVKSQEVDEWNNRGWDWVKKVFCQQTPRAETIAPVGDYIVSWS